MGIDADDQLVTTMEPRFRSIGGNPDEEDGRENKRFSGCLSTTMMLLYYGDMYDAWI